MLNIRSNLHWSKTQGNFDRGVIRGVSLALGLIAFGIVLGGGGWLHFIDLAGLMIVLGGTVGATLVNFSSTDLKRSWMAANQALRQSAQEPRQRISEFVSLSQAVRKDGLLVLERAAHRVTDPFMRKALALAVDGQSAQEVRRILDIEMKTSSERMSRAVQVIEAAGNYSPAMGLIGTLIGLIQMLSVLSDPAAVGSGMAVALATTLYGAVLANIFLLPLAGKIRNRCEEDLLVHALTIEGISSIISNENPIMLEQRLQGFIPQVLAA